jgi:type VI secretion system Hcp family effector
MTVYMRFQRNGQPVLTGECDAAGHEGWVEALSIHTSDHASLGASSGGASRPNAPGTLTIEKLADGASPQLQLESQHATPMSIDIDFVRRSDGKEQVFLSFTVNQAVITSDTFTTSAQKQPSEGQQPTEQLDIAFASMTIDPHGGGQDMSDQVCYLYDQVCYLDE